MLVRPALLLVGGAVAVALLTVALGHALPPGSVAAPPIGVAEFEANTGGLPNPAGPTIYLAVGNTGDHPIVHLSVTVHLNRPYTLVFQNVSPTSPLPPGGVASTSQTLFEGEFVCGASYILVFDGSYSGGSPFNETVPAPLSCSTTS